MDRCFRSAFDALVTIESFKRSLISERIKDAKRNLRPGNKHQGGKRPFGWQFGEANGHGRPASSSRTRASRTRSADILAMRSGGATLMEIRDAMRERGHPISHQTVANLLGRRAGALAGAAA
jgi:hypothetical protein